MRRRRSGIKVIFRVDSLTEVKRVVHIFPRNLILACNSSCNSLIPKMSLSKESKDAGRGANWSYEETITLINIWSDINLVSKIDIVYEK